MDAQNLVPLSSDVVLNTLKSHCQALKANTPETEIAFAIFLLNYGVQ